MTNPPYDSRILCSIDKEQTSPKSFLEKRKQSTTIKLLRQPQKYSNQQPFLPIIFYPSSGFNPRYLKITVLNLFACSSDLSSEASAKDEALPAVGRPLLRGSNQRVVV
jgi:hypothetical protein